MRLWKPSWVKIIKPWQTHLPGFINSKSSSDKFSSNTRLWVNDSHSNCLVKTRSWKDEDRPRPLEHGTDHLGPLGARLGTNYKLSPSVSLSESFSIFLESLSLLLIPKSVRILEGEDTTATPWLKNQPIVHRAILLEESGLSLAEIHCIIGTKAGSSWSGTAACITIMMPTITVLYSRSSSTALKPGGTWWKFSNLNAPLSQTLFNRK